MSESFSSDLESGRAAPASGYTLLVIALLMTALAYMGTLHFDFAYDDGPQIIANPTLTSWHYLPSLFLGHTWKFLLPDWPGNYYRPLFMSWLLVNRMLFGLNAALWHATTLAVHLSATWLAFVVARQILGNGTQAGFVALLFGLHPIHIESVAWISGVTDPLMAIFVFISLWAWLRGEHAGKHCGWWQALAAGMYFLGCLTKETALPLVVAVVAYAVFFQDERNILRATLRTWPLWISAAAYLAVRMVVLRGLIHPLGVSLQQAMISVPLILWEYLRRLVWPVRLSVFYDIFPVTGIAQWRFWLPFLGLILATAVAWQATKRFRIVGFSLLWILLFLSPVILGLPVFLVGEWVHDRYLYLPSFGFCLLLGYAIAHLPGKQKLFGYRAAPITAVMVLAALMSFATAWQEQYWTNSILLFVHAVNEAPNNAWAKGSLAGELFRAGDRENSRRMFEEALKVDPDNWKNNADYGNMLYRTGDYRAADEHYTRALKGDPSDANAHFNQGMSRFSYGNFAGAEVSFEAALVHNPNEAQAHYWLGFSLERQGKLEAARREYMVEVGKHSAVSTDAERRLAALAGN